MPGHLPKMLVHFVDRKARCDRNLCDGSTAVDLWQQSLGSVVIHSQASMPLRRDIATGNLMT